jgi:hypothetical protein
MNHIYCKYVWDHCINIKDLNIFQKLKNNLKLEFNGFRYRINGICLPEVNIINDKGELAQMSGWGYKKGFSETNLKFTIFKGNLDYKIHWEKYLSTSFTVLF